MADVPWTGRRFTFSSPGVCVTRKQFVRAHAWSQIRLRARRNTPLHLADRTVGECTGPHEHAEDREEDGGAAAEEEEANGFELVFSGREEQDASEAVLTEHVF